MKQVRRHAKSLPENAVPPEVIRFLSLDDLQDKIQMQKSATPVPIARDMQEVADHFKVLKPNAVVSEKSYDLLLQFHINAIHPLLRKMREGRCIVIQAARARQ